MINFFISIAEFGMLGALLGMGLLGTAIVYNKPSFLVYFQIIYCCVMRFFISELHFPSILRFLPDAVTALLLVHCVIRLTKTTDVFVGRLPLAFAGVFVLISILAFVANRQPVLSLMWGARVVLRAFVFWLASVLFLEKKDVLQLIQILFVLLVLNVFAVSLQYFVQGYRNDFVSGLFGTGQGANGEMNVFLMQMIICAMTMFIYYKCGWKLLGMTLGCAVFIAAVSELKAVFFEIPLIFGVLLICSGWKKRSVSLLLAGSVAVYISVMFFLILYPDWSDFFTQESIQSYVGEVGYGSEDSLNRMTAVPFVLENMLNTPVQWLVGHGLGNADQASFYTSALIQQYEDTHYHFFGLALLLAESGVLGSLVYLGFFGSVFFCSLSYRSKDPDNAWWYTMVMVGSALVVYHMIYNSVFRVDIIYNYMFWMAIPFVIRRENFIRLENKGKMVGAEQLREEIEPGE